MSGTQEYISTQEFAQKAGVSTSTVAKWLRKNKISGQKKGGKWMISPSELTKITPSKTGAPQKVKTAPPVAPTTVKKPSGTKTAFTIKEFSDMTYLTEFGVKKLLNEGRLIEAADKSGTALVDAASLERPDIKRLVRKTH